jgi:hypothetical protein
MEELMNAQPDNPGEWIAAITTLVGLIIGWLRKRKPRA